MSEIITIDGPASSGKSTVGFLFAQKIGFQFIDSGLIYRVCALLAKNENIDPNNSQECANVLATSDIQFKTEEGKVKVYLNNKDVIDLLKTPEIDQLVPIVAAHHEVREAAKTIQKKVASLQNTVVAGRDIGSEVFPDSQLKFFVTASVQARAKRRYDQQVLSHPEIKLSDIEEEIRQRDEKDSTRASSPMRIPEGAIVIDTSSMNIDQAVNELLKYYQEKFQVSEGLEKI